MTIVYGVGLAVLALLILAFVLGSSRWRRRQSRAARRKRDEELDRAFKRVADERRDAAQPGAAGLTDDRMDGVAP